VIASGAQPWRACGIQLSCFDFAGEVPGAFARAPFPTGKD